MDPRDDPTAPRRRAAGLVLLLALLTAAVAQEAAPQRWTLELSVDGAAAAWRAEPPAARDGDALVVPAGTARATVRFAGGWLDLNVADLGVWDEAHVLGVALRPSGGGWRVDATVRHADVGWEHYADLWRVVPADADGRVENGVRELLHPHDAEQPFTRSQGVVLASGRMLVEARDSLHGFGGSRVGLEPPAPAAAREVRWNVAASE